MEKEVTKVSYDMEKQELKLHAGGEVASDVSLAFSGGGIEQAIRRIVREEIAAHEKRHNRKINIDHLAKSVVDTIRLKI